MGGGVGGVIGGAVGVHVAELERQFKKMKAEELSKMRNDTRAEINCYADRIDKITAALKEEDADIQTWIDTHTRIAYMA